MIRNTLKELNFGVHVGLHLELHVAIHLAGPAVHHQASFFRLFTIVKRLNKLDAEQRVEHRKAK